MINFLLIGISAAIGAWFRWFIGAGFAGLFPSLLYGTLAVNLLGGLLMGLSIAFFQHVNEISEELKIIINVGFLGGLTTFSAYTADIFLLLQRGDFLIALLLVLAHVVGALTLCYLGFYSANLFLRSF